jgi:hypothetical protein
VDEELIEHLGGELGLVLGVPSSSSSSPGWASSSSSTFLVADSQTRTRAGVRDAECRP